jgi:hypothetical protein
MAPMSGRRHKQKHSTVGNTVNCASKSPVKRAEKLPFANRGGLYKLDELDPYFESYDASGPAGGVRAVDVWAEVKRLVKENER